MTGRVYPREGERYMRRRLAAARLRLAVQWAAAVGLVVVIAFGSAFAVWLVVRIIAFALASVTDLPTL